MKFISKIVIIIGVLLVPMVCIAQATNTVDTPFDKSKIFIVILVLITIFVGIFSFLLYLNKRINNLKDKINN